MTTWPTGREGVTAHVAGPPEAGVQKCARCDIILHSDRHGCDPPWYPGQPIGVTDSGMVRMALQGDHGHPECEP